MEVGESLIAPIETRSARGFPSPHPDPTAQEESPASLAKAAGVKPLSTMMSSRDAPNAPASDDGLIAGVVEQIPPAASVLTQPLGKSKIRGSCSVYRY
jgi:hypothetical protein